MSGTKVRFVALLTAACLLGDSMLYVVLPIFPEQFGLNLLWEVGVLLSVNRFIRIPIHPFVKKFYASFSTRQGLLVGLILTVISTFLYGILNTFLWLLCARVLWGIAWAFLKQGGQLSVMDAARESNRQSGKLTGLYNGISRTGSLVGMLLGGIGAGLFGTDILCFIFAGLALIFVPFIIRYIRNGHYQFVEKAESPKVQVVQNEGKYRKIIFILTMGFLLSLIYQGMLKSTLGYWIVIQENLTTVFLGGLGAAVWTGILQALRWGLEPIAAPWIGSKSDNLGSKLIVLTPTLLLASFLFLLLPTFIPTVMWLIAIIFLLSTATIVSTLLDAFVIDYAADMEKRSIVAHYLTISDAGAALGPIMGFLLIEMAGATSVALGGAAILLLTAILAGWDHWNNTKMGRNQISETKIS